MDETPLRKIVSVLSSFSLAYLCLFSLEKGTNLPSPHPDDVRCRSYLLFCLPIRNRIIKIPSNFNQANEVTQMRLQWNICQSRSGRGFLTENGNSLSSKIPPSHCLISQVWVCVCVCLCVCLCVSVWKKERERKKREDKCRYELVCLYVSEYVRSCLCVFLCIYLSQ